MKYFFAVCVALVIVLQLVNSLNVSKLSLAAQGACNDTQDLSAFVKFNSTFHSTLQDCASGCLGASACSATCIQQKVGLTPGCATCFGDDVGCTATNCVISCLSPSSPACVDCSNKYCLPALLTCAGVPKSALPN